MLRILTAATLLLIAASACAPRAEPIFGSGPDGARTITIRVANRNFDDATVWAFRYNERRRAGTVGAKSTEDLNVQWANPAPLRVEIRLIGGQTCSSREIQMQPGDVVSVEVPQNLRSDPVCRLF